MDCDTTGIEPDIALVKYKWMVGGGMIKIVNRTVPLALKRLGYAGQQVSAVLEYIDANDTIEGAPSLREEHLPVFDCAFKPAKGSRSIHYMGHVRMMAAVQPFVSGAIYKTVNMPSGASCEEIFETYVAAWKHGLKAIAIYRDGSKMTQALTTSREAGGGAGQQVVEREKIVFKPLRRRLPDERKSVTHKFKIGVHEGYVTVGTFEDGSPGEMFITMAKEGSTISGMMDYFATAISRALQYGVPLKVLASKFTNSRFEPSGATSNPDIRFAKSIIDYIFRWMGLKFLPRGELSELGIVSTGHANGEENGAHPEAKAAASEATKAPEITTASARVPPLTKEIELEKQLAAKSAQKPISPDEMSPENYRVTFDLQCDAPLCSYCGSITLRAGSCYKCENCGTTTGCG